MDEQAGSTSFGKGPSGPDDAQGVLGHGKFLVGGDHEDLDEGIGGGYHARFLGAHRVFLLVDSLFRL